jgi:ferredoxin
MPESVFVKVSLAKVSKPSQGSASALRPGAIAEGARLPQQPLVTYLQANNARCTGCRACLLACSLHLFGEINPRKAALAIIPHFPEPGYFEVRTCTQCGECAVVCPIDCISRNDIGAYSIDRRRCIACMACIDACPEGVIFTHPDCREPFKCDLCGECVAYCGVGALSVG